MNSDWIVYAMLGLLFLIVCCLMFVVCLYIATYQVGEGTTSPGESTEALPARSITMFSAEWCGACRRAKPIMLQLRGEGWAVRIIDIDENPDLAKKYRIRSIPVFFVHGENRVVLRTQNVYTAVAALKEKR